MSDTRIHNGVPPMIENRIDPTQGADARPVVIYQIQQSGAKSMWFDVDKETYDRYVADVACRIVYATRDAAPSDASVDALKWIKILVTGDSHPRWNNAHQTYISRGMIADIIDKAIAASAPREKA